MDVVVPTDVVNSVAAGALSGSFDVTNRGEARYVVPLWTPPAKGLAELSLSVAYGDGSPDGILGKGWSVKGPSSISRCGFSFIPDTVSREVRFDADDRFCLDGLRLVLVGAGTYGAHLAEYRTVPDTFIKVVSHQPDALGPTYFKAYFPNGVIATFGGDHATRSSRFEGERFQGKPAAHNSAVTTFASVGKVRLGWAQSQLEDRSGNALAYFYDPAAQGGAAQLLSEIRYTFNSATNVLSDAKRLVKFEYEARTDVSNKYISGLRLAFEKRLKSISMSGPAATGAPALVRKYSFAYDSAAPFTQLASIQECDGAGACQAPTTLQWTTRYSLHGAPGPTVAPTSTGIASIRPGDFNGDGCDDLLYYRSDTTKDKSGWYVSFQTACGGTAPPQYGAEEFLWASSPESMLIADVNADGSDDLIVVNVAPLGSSYTSGTVDVVLGGIVRRGTTLCSPFSCRATNLFRAAWDPSRYGLAPAVWFIDQDGDGLRDFIYAVNPTSGLSVLSYKRNFGTTVDANGETNPLTFSEFDQPLDSMAPGGALVGDTNGDGVMELLYSQYVASSWIWMGSSSFPDGKTALRLEGVVQNGRELQRQQWLTDLNGDGLVDLVEAPVAGGDLDISYNSGNGFESTKTFTTWHIPANTVGGDVLDNAIRFADMDGDGYTEIIQMTGFGGRPNNAAISATSVPNGALQSLLLGANGAAGILSGDQTYRGYSASMVLDANGDGLTDFAQLEGGVVRLYFSAGYKRHLLTGLKDGLGATVTIERTSIADLAVVKRTGCLPVGSAKCVTRNHSVVSRVTRTSAVPTQSARTSYGYDTPVSDLPSGRFVGFEARTIELPSKAGTVTETFNLSPVNGEYPYAGLPITATRDVVLSTGLVRRAETIKGYRLHTMVPAAPSWWVELTLSQESEFEFDPKKNSIPSAADLVLRRLNAFTKYDDFGSVLETVFSTSDGWSGSTTRAVTLDLPNWLLRNTTHESRTSKSPLGISKTRAVDASYTAGLLTGLIIEPKYGDCDSYLDESFDRKPDGNVWRVTAKGKASCGVKSRITTIDYEPTEGIWPERTTNAMGHETCFAYHGGLGVLGATTDPNNVLTTFQYDGFGRAKTSIPVGGQRVSWNYLPTADGLQVQTTPDAEPTMVDTYNSIGLVVTSSTDAYGSQGQIISRIDYDLLSRPVAWSAPRPAGSVEARTLVEYDPLGRPVVVTHPDSAYVKYLYSGKKVTRTDERGFDRLTVFDDLGHTESVTEALVGANGGQTVHTQYVYGPFGELAEVADGLGTKRQYLRDLRGRVVESGDPYAGAAYLSWNPFGELRGYETAKSRLQFERDALGRALNRTSLTGVDTFVWDTAVSGIGLLDYSDSRDNVRKRNKYDALGRVSSTTWSFDGNDYAFSSAYDGVGRLEGLQMPAISGYGIPTVLYSYKKGLVSTASELSTGAEWSAIEYDAEGRLIEEKIDNILTSRRFDNRGNLRFIGAIQGTQIQRLSMEYDPTGNVVSRSDGLNRVTEDFGYDSLSRLERWSVYQNCRKSQTEFKYDEVGNLMTRTPISGSDSPAQYGLAGKGIYNPVSYVGPSGSVSVDHDLGGRLGMLGKLVIKTDDLDRVTGIDDGTTGVELLTDTDRDFVVRTSPYEREISIAGLFRIRETSTGKTFEFFIPAAGTTVAKATVASGTKELEYLLRDSAGSIDVVARQSGPTEVKKYEPFGARRHRQSIATAGGPARSAMREGFAGGYEDEFGNVDMGGRLYVPQLHRFASSDPLVTDPGGSQGWNRTSYAWNNPATFNDSSGYCPKQSGNNSYNCEESYPWSPSGFEGSASLYSPKSSVLSNNWDQGGRVLNLGWFVELDPSEQARALHNAGIHALTVQGVTLPSMEEVWQQDVDLTWGQFNAATVALSGPAGWAMRGPLVVGQIGKVGATASKAALRLGPGAAGADQFVKKVVNSNMPHAAERAVERAGFATVKEARTALQNLGAQIENAGIIPSAAIRDTAHADRILVPGFGKGGAVVYQVRDGVLKLKTVLEWIPPPVPPVPVP